MIALFKFSLPDLKIEHRIEYLNLTMIKKADWASPSKPILDTMKVLNDKYSDRILKKIRMNWVFISLIFTKIYTLWFNFYNLKLIK